MKRRKPKKSCHKVGYKSPAQARKALKNLKHTGVKRYYKCPHCINLYHLTSEEMT